MKGLRAIRCSGDEGEWVLWVEDVLLQLLRQSCAPQVEIETALGAAVGPTSSCEGFIAAIAQNIIIIIPSLLHIIKKLQPQHMLVARNLHLSLTNFHLRKDAMIMNMEVAQLTSVSGIMFLYFLLANTTTVSLIWIVISFRNCNDERMYVISMFDDQW